ncbi:uncharacterized protein LOC126324753 isoform X2 [Schistocerca gregaria]|nr:uncharacterized protein LOC126324753 isoform X2 [Schistocerca gregaria]XP_049851060.1 uncharacterized protein LOC126324753 isoform X2 [Schistocerca gregaria]
MQLKLLEESSEEHLMQKTQEIRHTLRKLKAVYSNGNSDDSANNMNNANSGMGKQDVVDGNKEEAVASGVDIKKSEALDTEGSQLINTGEENVHRPTDADRQTSYQQKCDASLSHRHSDKERKDHDLNETSKANDNQNLSDHQSHSSASNKVPSAKHVSSAIPYSSLFNKLAVRIGDEDDMFSENFKEDDTKNSNTILLNANSRFRAVEPTDDDEGYYEFSAGETLHGSYEVLGYYGKGVYSNVIKARDISKSVPNSPVYVAIKFLRNNPHMKRAGRKEIKIIRRLNDADPEDKCHCLRMITSFEERDHLCLVFEALDLNLREVVKKYGHNVGISIQGVRIYAFQLFKALDLLRKNSIVHADLKPDNILVSEDRTKVKLGDFGSAFETQEFELTANLVSRFYRAPEIILGMMYPFQLDMWSMGCCLYELATGRYLLPSENDNHHLKLIMAIKGPFSKKMLQLCHPNFVEQYFANDGTFLERTPDAFNPNKVILKHVEIPQKSTRILALEIEESYGSMIKAEDKELVKRLADLINECLALDPRQRITPEKALRHPFF